MEGYFMFEFIKNNFKGATVTLALTGLPITITGEVINLGADNIVGLRLKDGNKVFINADLIAFVF